MNLSEKYSKEEFNLYNPAYVGAILYHSIREYQEINSEGMHCSLVYLIAPLSLSPRYSSYLPKSVSTPIAGWVSDHEGDLIGFSQSVNAYIDIVNAAIAFLLDFEAVNLSEEGRYFIVQDQMAKSPRYINHNATFKHNYLISGFLGRWFAYASSIESIYAHFGVRP